MESRDPNVRYDEAWHRRVDRTLFGHVSDDSGEWVDGLLQNLADSKRVQDRLAGLLTRMGLPLLIIIALSAVVTALHQPPAFARALLYFFGIKI